MDHPPPHSFSRSPVEEVFCRCFFRSDAESLILTIKPPYPGWPHIRAAISDMIAGAGETSRITGCILRYTDLIPVIGGRNVPGIEDIEKILSLKFNCYLNSPQNKIILTGMNIPDTSGAVCSFNNRFQKPGWTLIFTIYSEGRARFDSCESVLKWFDDARAEIHGLFDLIVPAEIVLLLR